MFDKLVCSLFGSKKMKERIVQLKQLERDFEESQKKIVLTTVPILFVFIIMIAIHFQMASGFWAFSLVYFVNELGVLAQTFSIYIIAKTAMAIPMSYLLGRIKSKNKAIFTVFFFTIWALIMNLIAFLFPTNWLLLLIVFSLPMYPLFNVIFYSLMSSFSTKKRRATAFGILNAAGIAGYVSGILILGASATAASEGIYIMLKISVIFAAITLFISSVFLIYSVLFKKIRKVNNIV